jgi:hypothetical protein
LEFLQFVQVKSPLVEDKSIVELVLHLIKVPLVELLDQLLELLILGIVVDKLSGPGRL